MGYIWVSVFSHNYFLLTMKNENASLEQTRDQKGELSYSMMISSVQFSSVQTLSRVQPFKTPWTAARQPSLSITNSQSLLKPMFIELVMPSNHTILCGRRFPPAFNLSQHQGLFKWVSSSGGQSIGVWASASVLPVNIQDWFPLGWSGWISLQSKGLSRVFSNTTIQNHQFFSAQLSL